MRLQLLDTVIKILGVGKIYPTLMSDPQQVRDLIRSLRPRIPERPLIRLGPPHDGGYLVPDDLEGIEACFSPGVSTISGFERDCAERGMQVFMADKSVDGPAEAHERFHFTKKFIGMTNNADFMTLDHWVDGALPGSQGDLLLQIDIEGFEYEAFISATDQLMRRFRIIVAEFHDLEKLWSKAYFQMIARVFGKILQTHTCVHIHPNNARRLVTKGDLAIPRVAEFTFLRNDRQFKPGFAQQFPHPLDADSPRFKPMPLPACWYGEQ